MSRMVLLGGDDVENGFPREMDFPNDDVRNVGVLLGSHQQRAKGHNKTLKRY